MPTPKQRAIDTINNTLIPVLKRSTASLDTKDAAIAAIRAAMDRHGIEMSEIKYNELGDLLLRRLSRR